jgi:hypothetical protein
MTWIAIATLIGVAVGFKAGRLRRQGDIETSENDAFDDGYEEGYGCGRRDMFADLLDAYGSDLDPETLADLGVPCTARAESAKGRR